MGRPVTLTRELIEQIVALVRLGNYPLVAARACGVPEGTFYDWLARGRQRDAGAKRAKRLGSSSRMPTVGTGEAAGSIFVELVEALTKAEGYHETRMVGALTVGAEGSPRDTISLLERRYPQRWRSQSTTEMVGPEGGPIRQEVVTEEKPPDVEATLAGILEALARAGKLPK